MQPLACIHSKWRCRRLLRRVLLVHKVTAAALQRQDGMLAQSSCVARIVNNKAKRCGDARIQTTGVVEVMTTTFWHLLQWTAMSSMQAGSFVRKPTAIDTSRRRRSCKPLSVSSCRRFGQSGLKAQQRVSSNLQPAPLILADHVRLHVALEGGTF